jgi:hypothetical protein
LTHTHTQCIARQDDGIRPDTSVAALSKLKAAFAKDGTTTAGNSSQVSDGAAAVLLARASTAAALQLPVLAVLRSYAVVGVPPDVMGIGPAFAIPEAVRKAGLTLNDIDVFEINEAFASQVALTLLLTLSLGSKGFFPLAAPHPRPPPPLARPCTASATWACLRTRSTRWAGPSPWATPWAPRARGSSSPSCTTSNAPGR